MSINSVDPAEIASRVLGGASMLGATGRGLASSVSTGLSAASKALLGIDAFDQDIPALGLITDGLTVSAGIGSLIATAFEKGPKLPKAPVAPQEAGVGGSYGT
mgnify:FL=1|tara:strand:+ start:404 stop:712 length:309 start_codon:yes stop_codon:yes gene_type:complete